MEFENQVIVVTGAAQGIGACLTHALINQGAIVVGLDANENKLNSVLLEVKQPKQFVPYHVDITNSEAVNTAIDSIEENVGSIHYLIHAAGIIEHGRLSSFSDTKWQRIISVNCTGAFHVLRSISQKMIVHRRGSIVVIGSNAAGTPRINMAAYAASKAAVTQLTRCMGLELAEFGIRCNIVSPGSTDTDMLKVTFPDRNYKVNLTFGDLKTFRTGIPLKKIATTSDIANAVVFLLSERASHITLHDMRVDGGATFDLR